MTCKERANRAIHFNNPDRPPVLMFNKDFEESDLMILDVVKHFEGKNNDTSEFGFVWKTHDGTMGQPKECLINEWEDFDRYQFPDPMAAGRFDDALRMMKQYGDDKYYIAGLSLSGYIVGDSYRCVWVMREYPPSTDEQAILFRLADRNDVTLRIYNRLVEGMEQKQIVQNATR